jgi:hypothetical protein
MLGQRKEQCEKCEIGLMLGQRKQQRDDQQSITPILTASRDQMPTYFS